MLRDCWLDPYGQIYYVPEFGHEDGAEFLLRDEFPMENETTPMRTGPLAVDTWHERGFRGSFGETLQARGWMRFTSTINRWSCEHSIDYLNYYPAPNRIQIDRMWELTGFNYDDDTTYSHYPYHFDETAPNIVEKKEKDW